MLSTTSRYGQRLVASVVMLGSCPTCFGQPPERIVGKEQLEASSVESVSPEMVEAQIKQVDESKELDDATKKLLSETLSKAKASLQKEVDEQKGAAKFAGWVKSAAADTTEAESRKKQPAKVYDFTSADDKQLNELTKDLAALERERDTAKQEFEVAKNEPQRRAQRLQAISDDIAAARKTLEESERALEALKQNDASTLAVRTRKLQIMASRQATLAVIAAREAERRAYETQVNLPRLWIDIAAERLKQLETAIEDLGNRISDRRQYDAGEQLKGATESMADASEPLKPL
jgi:chromosome segregation ATPase